MISRTDGIDVDQFLTLAQECSDHCDSALIGTLIGKLKIGNPDMYCIEGLKKNKTSFCDIGS